MISWIKGEVVSLWQTNNKFYTLINCNGLGYEIQIQESVFIKLKTNQITDKNLILWLKHIKKEDSDTFFGFISKEEKDFFNKILNIKGLGSQIGMSILNKFSINEIIDAINTKNKKLIGSVQGIGQKMTERIILELKIDLNTKSNTEEDKNSELFHDNTELSLLLKDLEITLESLKYSKREIKNIYPILVKEIKRSITTEEEAKKITFEYLLKQAMGYLDKKNSNKGQ